MSQRRGTQASQASTSEPSPSLQLGEALATSNDAEIAIESLLTLSGSRSAPKTPATESMYDSNMAHAPVPKLARLLRDGHGKFIFVGDSSNLAFLQNIRRLARNAIGESSLTSDPMRHGMIEAIPTAKETSTPRARSMSNMKPSKTEAEELVNNYIMAASGVVDLFDKADIMQHLGSWTEGSAVSSNSTDSIFYLVLAIGARNRGSEDDDIAELYFTKGRDLAVSSFMDDPSVLTVQSYVLIAFFLLSSCRRNGAFMLLGIAIRAAYALGLHRSDISALFESRERRTRERVWKSLRVLDLFMSASLGRPPATSEVDGGNVAWESKGRVYEDIRMGALHSSAMLRICFIFERILNEVYCRREVDVQLVNSISAQYRDWNMALDAGLDIDGLVEGDDEATSNIGLQQMIGIAHLKGAYYWSIILLTRPFLIFDVSSRFEKDDKPTSPSSKANADTTTLSEACIDAALRSIEVASDIVHTPGCPKRPFLILNSLFVSALVVGLAMFGDYDKSFPLLSSLDQAKIVLGQLAKHDPSGRRFFAITTYLQQAALENIRRRDEKQLQKRRQGIHSIFGDLLNREPTSISSESDKAQTEATTVETTNFTSPGTVQDMPWTQRVDEAASKKGPTLTTSGVLASSARDGASSTNDTSVTEGDDFLNQTLPGDQDLFTLPQNVEEFPLFSLMNDYTMGDTYFDMI
ncbi:hypothetical protein H2198_007488 [Neophaeococcomyces mojaviensis]|uniref:Uncharacterized protein n=1 Tax=Neophaeococcomyces mojaviensis TaxID=3383035 RepID=A0ACC2ZZT3_9EURO|nr:hypothetical protein H2198_007488 [Knufia sp. JES_112]